MKKIKIIVLGRYGQVATNLFELFELEGENSIFNTTFYTSKDVDFSFPEKVQLFLKKSVKECDYIINCAAYNYVDKAEIEQELCDNINHQSVKKIAEFCANKGIKFIHYSTDYVFDGRGDLPYDEENSENLNPLNFYGKSKLAGEVAIKKSGCEHLIFRVSWTYDTRSNFKNFFNTIKVLSKKEEKLRIVNDQIGSPTSAYFIASNTIRIIKKIDSSFSSFPSGIYHLNNGKFISWYEMATEIIDSLRQDKEIVKTKTIVPIASSEYKTSAIRPLNSRLANKKIIKTFGLEFSELQKKYIAVFAHFDKDNIIDDYVLFYLKGLKEVCSKIIFVSDCDLQKEEIDKLDNLCFHVIAKKHGEYDFGSYKRGFFYIKDSGIIEDCDELIFANDSCYGPLRPLAPIFRSMEYRLYDFWGMTQNKDIYIEHIQSYFVVLSKAIMLNKSFSSFLQDVTIEKSKKEIIEKYEIGLTHTLINAGFNKNSFIKKLDNDSDLFYKRMCPVSNIMPEYFPFLKVSLIKQKFFLSRCIVWNIDSKISKTIDKDNVILIRNHIRRTLILRDQFAKIGLNAINKFINISNKNNILRIKLFGTRILKLRM